MIFYLLQNNRIIRMRQAVEVYLLQIVEENSYVGIVTFSEGGEVKSQIRQVTSADIRKQLASDLPVASYGDRANVCTGVQLALQASPIYYCLSCHISAHRNIFGF